MKVHCKCYTIEELSLFIVLLLKTKIVHQILYFDSLVTNFLTTHYSNLFSLLRSIPQSLDHASITYTMFSIFAIDVLQLDVVAMTLN